MTTSTDVNPRPGARSRLLRMRVPLAVASLAGVGVVYLAAHDPLEPGSLMPRCPTKAITGFDCPACGGLRMIHSLTRGDFAAAAHNNIVLLICLPILLIAGVVWVRTAWTGTNWRRPSWVPSPLVIPVVAVIWMVVRNVPAFPLHPLV